MVTAVRHHRRSGAPLLVALVVTTACHGKDAETAPNPAVAWTGWTYAWETLCHRVSLARVIQEEDGSVDLGLVGGDWSTGAVATDTPTYRLRCQEVRSADFEVLHGSTNVVTEPDGVVSATASIEDADLAALPHQVVLLRGFAIDTDVAQAAGYPAEYDPALGYVSRGFGFGVGTPTVDGDTITFDVSGSVRWGTADPDDFFGRQDMNAAVAYARTGVTVAWTVVGFDGDLATATVTSMVDYAHDPPNSDQPPLTIPVDIDPGQPGLAGMISFDLAVDVPDSATDSPPQGEYLRSFGAELITDDGASIELQTEATNSSLVETAAIRFTPTVEVAWIELADPDATVTGREVEGTHEVGLDTAQVCLQP